MQKKIIKIRPEIDEIENQCKTERINKTKSWCFEKSNEINKLLVQMVKTKNRRHK